MPVPILALAKVNTGAESDPKVTISPPKTPTKVGDPVALAEVVPLYCLFSPVIPVIVNTPGAVVSLLFSPVVS